MNWWDRGLSAVKSIGDDIAAYKAENARKQAAKDMWYDRIGRQVADTNASMSSGLGQLLDTAVNSRQAKQIEDAAQLAKSKAVAAKQGYDALRASNMKKQKDGTAWYHGLAKMFD